MGNVSARSIPTPLALRIGGGLIFGAAALPFSPTGLPFWRLAVEAFAMHPVHGAIVALGYGAPFWFGLTLLLAPGDLREQGGRARVSQWLLGLMHAQLILTAWMIARAGVGVAPWSLFGFAAVSGLYFVSRGGRFSADSANMAGAAPPMWWLARWGAVMVVALCGWLRLQNLIGLSLGWAVEVAFVGGALVAWRTAKLRVRVVPADPVPADEAPETEAPN